MGPAGGLGSCFTALSLSGVTSKTGARFAPGGAAVLLSADSCPCSEQKPRLCDLDLLLEGTVRPNRITPVRPQGPPALRWDTSRVSDCCSRNGIVSRKLENSGQVHAHSRCSCLGPLLLPRAYHLCPAQGGHTANGTLTLNKGNLIYNGGFPTPAPHPHPCRLQT